MRCVVLLGAGGAGSAIAHAALGLGAAELRLMDTDPARAGALADALQVDHPARAVAFDDVAQALDGGTGLIHATPTGMAEPDLPLAASLLRPSLWVSEVVYVPIQTPLLNAARAVGCPTVDGGAMAVGQAVDAFELCTGRKVHAGRMERHSRGLLVSRGSPDRRA